MEQTTNCQLNQWDKSDRILMEDFNADNLKIDAALAAEAEARSAADTAEETARKNAVAAEAAAREQAVAAEASARQAAVTAEETARKNAVAAEASARQTADTTEANARAAADEALAAKAGAQLIDASTLSAAADHINISLTGIDWGQWSRVCVSMSPVLASGDTYSAYLLASTGSDHLVSSRTGKLRVVLRPFFTPDMQVDGYFWPPEGDVSALDTDNMLFQNLTMLQVSAKNGNLEAGTATTIWGWK